MPWLPDGDARCDSCPATRACVPERALAIQMMRAGGWRHMVGTTLGGEEFETILCPGCTRDEKRKSRKTAEVEQDALPLDWEKGRVVVGRQGSASR